MIRERTKAAMQAAKARGVKLGLNGAILAKKHKKDATDYARSIEHHMRAAQAAGATTLTDIANWLTNHNVPSRQGARWHPQSVKRVMRRLRLPAQQHEAD